MSYVASDAIEDPTKERGQEGSQTDDLRWQFNAREVDQGGGLSEDDNPVTDSEGLLVKLR